MDSFSADKAVASVISSSIVPHNPAGADKSEGRGRGADGSECLADVPTESLNPQTSTRTQGVQFVLLLNEHQMPKIACIAAEQLGPLLPAGWQQA